jgi:hypothetical protein
MGKERRKLQSRQGRRDITAGADRRGGAVPERLALPVGSAAERVHVTLEHLLAPAARGDLVLEPRDLLLGLARVGLG